MPTILHTESSMGWGGQEIRIFHEALGMKARGHRVLVAAQPGSELIRRVKEAGLNAVEIPMSRRFYPLALGALLRLIRKEQVDVVNTHSSRDSWLASLASRLSTGKPVVIRTRHLSTPVSPRWPTRFLYGRLPQRVVTTGEAIREALIQRLGCSPHRVVSVPTGVDLERFRPGLDGTSLRREWGIPQDAKVVGNVAVLRSWKGHRDLMEAVYQVRGCRFPAYLVIAGDGPQQGNLETCIRDRGFGDWVRLLGHRDDVPRVLASLDVYVHASYGHEGVPQALVQAMAAGVPCVSTETGSVRELIRHEHTGLVAPPRDPMALAQAMARLLEDPRLGTEMAVRARAHVEHGFGLVGMLDRMEKLYREALDERPG